MPEVVTCPQCERQLRVPEELIGQRVKCPTCGTNFTAIINRASAEEVVDAVSQGNSPKDERRSDTLDDDYDQPDNRSATWSRVRTKVMLPAIFLLIISMMGLLCDGLGMIRALAARPPTVKEIEDQMPALKGNPGIEIGIKMSTGPTGALLISSFLFLTLITLAGSIAMMAGRTRWLAITGSLAAMINNPLYCCCVLGLPFGIWSLVVLLSEDVKKAFK
jgi:predicted Zn finger-like uncharacterized protein